METKPAFLPLQQQNQRPGPNTGIMPRPKCSWARYRGSDKRPSKVVLLTGGGSGIGRTVAVPFAREGATRAFAFLPKKPARIRSVAQQPAEKKIRTAPVAPVPVRTLLLPAGFPLDKTAKYGQGTAAKRPGQPSAAAPAFAFPAPENASSTTGRAGHPNGVKGSVFGTKALLFWALAGLALLVPVPGAACPVCRPKVQAAIHTADYAATVALLWLPVAVLLALGLALYWAESLQFRRTASPTRPQAAP